MSFLTASPNWYCCKVSDCNEQGVYIFGAQNKVYIFSVADFLPKFTRCIDAHSERITSLSFSAKENWIFCSGSEDGFLKVWNIHEKILIKQHAAHQPGKISAVSWSCVNDTLIVSGDDKGDICIWRLDVDPVIYNPERGNVSDLKTSLHDEDIVAVGYKSGLILLINIGNKRSIIHKLKGHDEEIQSIVWYPFKHHKMDEESWRDVTGDSIVEPSQVMGELGSGCLIASGSKDKSIRVWSSNNGKCLQILKLPNNIGYRRHEEPGLRGRLWLTLTWLKNKPRHLVSSSFGGELLLWDLNKQGKQKWQVFGVGKEGQNRTIFNICPVPPDDDTLITISMGRQIVFWDVPSMKSKIILPTLGGFLYSICYSNLNPGFLALGVGDNMIRVWNTGNPNDSYDITVLWQGIRSNVTTVSWHPEKEGILAYGTKDGRVGIYNTFSNKAPEVSNTYHKDTVYVVTWGPACYGEMDEISSEINLYSVGDGFILQHQRNQFQKDAVNVNDLIKQTNKMSHCSQKSEMRWKSDLSIVAIGNEDGSVDLCKPPHLKILCTVCVQRKLVNCLRWHPTFTMSSPSGSALHSWLAIGSNENIVKVIDTISVLVQESSESTQTLTTCIRELEGHTARVTSLSWSTHVDGLLVSASYDGTAQVWNVITGEPLGNYRGHSERLLSVQWSPLFVDEIYSGGCDLSLHKWDVKTLTEKLPPKEGNTSFKGKENDKKRSNKSKKKKKEPMKTNETKNSDLESLISVDNLNNEEITELEQLLEQKRREILDAAKTKTIISSSVDGVIDVSKRSESVKDIENSDHFDKDISVPKQPAYIPDNCKDIIKKSETIKSIKFPKKKKVPTATLR